MKKLEDYVVSILDYPQEGIIFRDITSILEDADGLKLAIDSLIEEVKRNDYNLVIVTNEVGDSIVPEHHISRVFRDIQGRVNQRIAEMSDSVYLVCCGIPVKIK